ncbi:hypothetical protein [Tropicibacter oceani]|uniref:Uncharacterized protein n=1 Tax=Tropicibacter oceani TaxID=3058420 RepID=A0ABY8QCR1_9RHOB|nr:hypothetical protein [Tropicibacter oceani]WGW02411.1 hypothetical protein QF118_10660 [Tropicibacter oceani]
MTWTFNSPGYVTDFTDPGKWHEEMAQTAGGIVFQLAAEVLGRNPQTQAELEALRPQLGYVDPTEEAVPEGAETVATAQWFGFPQSVERRDWSDITQAQLVDDPQGFYRAVEDLGQEDIGNARIYDRLGHLYELPVRHRQDEYLEWRVSEGQREITFVSEGYDYFSALFDADEDAVVTLYREFLKTDAITADDLRAPQGLFFRSTRGEHTIARPGGFNPRNRFNIFGGICHLSHRANSLGAEVNLAGVSALARVASDGELVAADNAERIICCSSGGDPNRNSDPGIARDAYTQVLDGYRYTLADPVGLYIADVAFTQLRLPDETQPVPRAWWHEERGAGRLNTDDSRILRVTLRIPDGETYQGRPMTLSDLTIGGSPVRFPGQLAELVKVHLYVTRWARDGGGVGPRVRCIGTCCAGQGSAFLLPTSSGCGQGLTDQFPGLIGPAEPGNMMSVAPMGGAPGARDARR